MQLLDATLAMVLTMAALATIVTILMETGVRIARMRKKNLIEVMRLLNQELGGDKDSKNTGWAGGVFGLSAEERWKFITGVVENPANAVAGGLAKRLEHENWVKKSLKKIGKFLGVYEKETKKFRDENGKLTEEGLNTYLAKLGRKNTVGSGRIYHYFTLITKVPEFLLHIFGDRKRAGLYDKVSLEHVLRRLAETEKVKGLSLSASDKVKVELNRLARKYEEYGSAVAAGFKRNMQAWSVFVGIGFAIFANVDGLRIFESYRADNALANTIIKQQEKFVESHAGVTTGQEKLEQADKKVKDLEADVKAKREAVDKETDAAKKQKLQKELEEVEKNLVKEQAILESMVSVEQVKQSVEKAKQQAVDLVALGVPIGWSFYPNCPFGKEKKEWEKADSRCRDMPKENWAKQWPTPAADSNCLFGLCKKVSGWLNSENVLARTINTARRDTGSFIQWLITVIITGVLIGLGAPFWFDVAKRLAQVRSGSLKPGSKEFATGEERMSAKDANGDPQVRMEIVNSVIKDTVQ